MSLGVILGVLASLAEFVEAVTGGLVAGPGALAQCLDGVVMRPFEPRTNRATAQADQTRGTSPQDAQQFTSIHDVTHVSIDASRVGLTRWAAPGARMDRPRASFPLKVLSAQTHQHKIKRRAGQKRWRWDPTRALSGAIHVDCNFSEVSTCCEVRIGFGRIDHLERPIDDGRQPMRRDGSGGGRQIGDRAAVVSLDAQALLDDGQHVDGRSGAGQVTDHEDRAGHRGGVDRAGEGLGAAAVGESQGFGVPLRRPAVAASVKLRCSGMATSDAAGTTTYSASLPGTASAGFRTATDIEAQEFI